MNRKFNDREAGMEKNCTHLKVTFEVVVYEFQIHSPLCVNQRFNSSFLNCSVFLPFKDAPGTSSSVKIVRKGFVLFELLASSQASFAAIVRTSGSLTTTTRMQCAHDVIMQICYYPHTVLHSENYLISRGRSLYNGLNPS